MVDHGLTIPLIKEEIVMKKSILNHKWILLVDNEPDVLIVLEEEILKIAPNCHIDKTTHYKNAAERLASFTYDLVILDSLTGRSSDLLSRAVTRFHPFPVVILTSRSSDQGVLKGFLKMGAQICLPKQNSGDIIPFLEDVVRHESFPRWKRLLEESTGLFRSKLKSGWREESRFELRSAGGTESIS